MGFAVFEVHGQWSGSERPALGDRLVRVKQFEIADTHVRLGLPFSAASREDNDARPDGMCRGVATVARGLRGFAPPR